MDDVGSIFTQYFEEQRTIIFFIPLYDFEVSYNPFGCCQCEGCHCYVHSVKECIPVFEGEHACFCGKPRNGVMVQCARREDCFNHEWFHLECTGLEADQLLGTDHHFQNF